MPMAIIAFCKLGPRNAANAIARIRNGEASIASTSRPMIISVLPPANPASNPIGTPTPVAIVTEITPAVRLARAPQIIRLSTSRPFSSVPIQFNQDGALRIIVQLVLIGSNGAIHGANTATTMKNTTTTSPITAAGREQNRRTAIRPGDCDALAITAPALLAWITVVALMRRAASG